VLTRPSQCAEARLEREADPLTHCALTCNAHVQRADAQQRRRGQQVAVAAVQPVEGAAHSRVLEQRSLRPRAPATTSDCLRRGAALPRSRASTSGFGSPDSTANEREGAPAWRVRRASGWSCPPRPCPRPPLRARASRSTPPARFPSPRPSPPAPLRKEPRKQRIFRVVWKSQVGVGGSGALEARPIGQRKATRARRRQRQNQHLETSTRWYRDGSRTCTGAAPSASSS
jgi:hypothetical protein